MTPFRARPKAIAATAGVLAKVGLVAALAGGRVATADGAPPPPAAGPTTSAAAPASGRMGQGRPATPVDRSPTFLAISPDGARAFAVDSTSNTVSILDVQSRSVVAEIAVGARPVTAAPSPDGHLLYVACSWANAVDVVDLRQGKVVRSLPVGDEPYGLAPSADGRRLSVVGSLSGTVSILDLASGDVLSTTPVGDQPRFVAATARGDRLVVANGLSRSLSVIDATTGRETERRDLGRTSILRQVAVTRDGRWAFVASVVSHDETFSLQMERGWIHSNGVTAVDLATPGHRATILLDRLFAGAANPTGIALSADETRLYVTLSGVHELAIVDVAGLTRLAAAATTAEKVKALEEDVEVLAKQRIARRVPTGGLGPRGLVKVEATGEVWVANYFSDSVTVLDAETGALRATIPLGPPHDPSLWRRGELLFADARLTYQGWFTCVSCHQEDATVDGLAWDLPNDGLGNAKSAKSLHDAYDTAPAMWSGVRANLDAATAAGERFQGFLPVKENHEALLEYLRNPERAPNPHRGRTPEAEARGKAIFTEAGCDVCHPAPRYTDQKPHDVGLGTPDDYRSRFDTPSLRETLRTGPWLHDGRARTLRSIFTDHNPRDLHGRTRGLGAAELDYLLTFVRTL